MRVVIPVRSDAQEALRGFLARLLETGVVDTLLVPMITRRRYGHSGARF
jgi:hypothetical protein